MMKTASASDLLDATIPPAIGVEIEEGCPQSLLEKRKHAETGDGSQQSQPPPTEKRNRGENEEQLLESLQPRGKQGGCKCKGGENEGYNCKGGGERKQISFDELPPHAQLYFQKLKAIVGHEVRVGIPCADSDEEPIGDISSMIADQNWPADDYGYCCSNPFEALDFKEDPKLYEELRVFGEKAVAYLKNQFNKTACFEDIERVESCPAPCKHHVVTIKARGPRGPCEEVWEIVLRGKVLGGFLEAKNKTLCFDDIERVKSCPAPCKHHVVTIKAKGPCEEVWEIVLRGKVGWGFLEAKAHEFLMLKYSRL